MWADVKASIVVKEVAAPALMLVECDIGTQRLAGFGESTR